MRLALTLAAIAAVLYLAACGAFFFLQRSMIYYPQPVASAPAAQRMAITAEGAQLAVDERPRDGPRALLYFGGNAEDVSARLAPLSAAFPHHAIYLMNYRGYGGSTGAPTERALHQDALLLFDRVHARHADVTVIGTSLGSGVAVRLASVRPVARLVLVTPYESLSGLAASLFPWLPVRWLLTERFESGLRAPRVKAPTLILAAEHDEVIPRWSTDQLLARFRGGVATLKVIAGAGHNTISQDPAYWSALRGNRCRAQGNTMPTIESIQQLLQPLFPGLMGVRLTELAPERVVAQMQVRPDLCTSGRILHGGASMAFADTLGAVGTVLNLPPGKRTTTTDSSTKFIGGAREGTTVTGECVALHRGRTTMVWQTSIRNAEGKLCTVVTQTQLVLD